MTDARDAVSRAVEAGARALSGQIAEQADGSYFAVLTPLDGFTRDEARRCIAAFLRSLATSPTPEMVAAGEYFTDREIAPADLRRAWRAMASKAAEQVETTDAG